MANNLLDQCLFSLSFMQPLIAHVLLQVNGFNSFEVQI